MPILENIHETFDYTFYDSFRFGCTEGLQRHSFFQRGLSNLVSMLETNMYRPGILPAGQSFHPQSFKIAFVNTPEPWDIAQLARKCTFTFSVNAKIYAQGFVRALLSPSSLECNDLRIHAHEPFSFELRAECPLTLDPQGSGLHGHLFMQGKLQRPIQ